LSIGFVAYTDDGYLSHCSFSFGISFKAGGDIVGSHGLNIILMDGFGDYYKFTYNPDENDVPKTGLNVIFSLPFYYNTYFSTGLFGQMIANGIFNDSSTMYFGGGLYIEGKYNNISLRSGIGISNIGISKSIGKVNSAWAGDPGFYTGSEFVKPGESLIATTDLFQEISGITFNIELKYNFKRFFRGTHIKLGYYFYPGIEITDYEIKLGERGVESSGDDPSFTLSPVHNIGILFGWGL
jgi:hypothetical protein